MDFNSPRDQLRKDLAHACENWGFFSLVNHGIPGDTTSRALSMSAGFFSQSLAKKQQLSRTLDNPWGYYDRELTKNLRDRKEIFDFGPGYQVHWPKEPPGFRDAQQALSEACYRVGLVVLEEITAALELPEGALRQAFDPVHTSFTRLNYYAVDDVLADADVPAAGPLGISRHTDAGGLTLLLQDEVAGLQVFRDQWVDVEPVEGALTVNIGDMVQVWSNDRFKAPLHRVKASEDSDRYSIAYFLNPASDCMVEPLVSTMTNHKPNYSAIPWAEFRDLRAQGDYADYGEEIQISKYRIV